MNLGLQRDTTEISLRDIVERTKNSMKNSIKKTKKRNSIKSYKKKTTQLLREAKVGKAGWGGGWGSPEVGMGFSGAGIIGHYEPHDMGAGDSSRSFARIPGKPPFQSHNDYNHERHQQTRKKEKICKCTPSPPHFPFPIKTL